MKGRLCHYLQHFSHRKNFFFVRFHQLNNCRKKLRRIKCATTTWQDSFPFIFLQSNTFLFVAFFPFNFSFSGFYLKSVNIQDVQKLHSRKGRKIKRIQQEHPATSCSPTSCHFNAIQTILRILSSLSLLLRTK